MGRLIDKLELGSRKPQAFVYQLAFREPGDMLRKDVRRNSIDLSEVEYSTRSGRVRGERARNERMSFRDEKLGKSSREFVIRSPLLFFLTT
jgi:hypothetical protein